MKNIINKCLSVIISVTVLLSLCSCADDAHEHSYGEWEETKKASCTEAGESVRKCECGEQETKAIDPLGHKGKDVCEVCGKRIENGGAQNGSGEKDKYEIPADADKDVDNDESFDYLTFDPTEYLTVSLDEFRGIELSVNIAKPRSVDVDDAILKLLASEKGEVLNGGAKLTAVTIAPGDVVDIWYRGYILDEDGEEVFLPGMCNFSGNAPSSLSIGSGQFVPGFEFNLVGKNTGDYPKLVKITEGEIKETQIAYVSYSRLAEGGKSTDTETGSFLRIDLSDETVDETYGTGFRAQILSANIGAKKNFGVTLDGKTYNYTDTIVHFVTECEVDPLLVECYFPYDYGMKELQNKTAYFEVYVDGVVEYECPKLTEEYVLNKAETLGIDLSDYEGEGNIEKFRAYIEALIYAEYEETYRDEVGGAMWEKIFDAAKVKKYPGIKVSGIYKEYVDDVYHQFEESGGTIYGDGIYYDDVTYDNIDDYAMAYLGLTYSKYDDWREYLYDMAKSLVKERLVLYYIFFAEELISSEEELDAEIDALKQEYLDEYIAQYLESIGMSREDYTDEAYAEFCEKREEELFAYYSDEYFAESVCYNFCIREISSWPQVTTLDGKVN